MDTTPGGCLCGQVRLRAAGRPYRVGLCHCLDCRKHHGALFHASAVFGRSGDEVEVNLGALVAPDQLVPACELWTVRREAWLPPFGLPRGFARDRDGAGRSEP